MPWKEERIGKRCGWKKETIRRKKQKSNRE